MARISQPLLDKPVVSEDLRQSVSVSHGLQPADGGTKGWPPFSKKFIRVKSAPIRDAYEEDNKCSKKSTSNVGLPRRLSTLYIAIAALAVYLATGLLLFLSVKSDLLGQRTSSFIDTLYFCIVTMTTVGYGDLVPSTNLTKLLTCTFVFVGFGIVGALLSSAAHYLVEKQERFIEKAIHKRKHRHVEKLIQDAKIKPIHWKVFVTGIVMLTLFSIGMVVLIKVEGKSSVDAFYVVSVTVTTLGYGDESFKTPAGRAFAIVWILISTISVAQFFLYVAEWTTEARQHSFAEWLLTRKVTSSDLEAADLNEDGVVSAAEFIIFKLKEMGKIDHADVITCLKEFNGLDIDQSGNLSLSDIRLLECEKSIA